MTTRVPWRFNAALVAVVVASFLIGATVGGIVGGLGLAIIVPSIVLWRLLIHKRYRTTVLLLLLVAISTLSTVLIQSRRSGPSMVAYTEIETVAYRGEARFIKQDNAWTVKHLVVVDSATATRMHPRFWAQSPFGSGNVRSVLLADGWTEDGSERDGLRFASSTSVASRAKWSRASAIDRLVVPTLGKRFFAALVIVADRSSRMTLASPSPLILETDPAALSKGVALDRSGETVVASIPYAEGGPAAVAVRLAGPLFRNRLLSPLLARDIRGWLWLGLAVVCGAVAIELQRRLGRPYLQRLLDRLGVPDNDTTT